MPKALGFALAAVLAIVALGFGGRAYANRAMSTRALTPKTLGSGTPASAGLPFSRVAVETGDRTLIGWWVRARADSGRTPPALLFLHGNRSSISDYIGLQKFLYRQGVSSFVFDYSGFGASGGSASLKNAYADAASAARVFADSAGKSARKVAMGSAAGATVLLQAIDSVQPHVNGVVIEGVAASVKESAIRDGRLPKLMAPLVVDVANNVDAARKVKVPLLAVHSFADERFPIEDAQRVVAAVPARTSLVRHWRKGHSALLASSKTCDWEPILRFVKEGALPTARVDTLDACAEAARLAAAQKPTVTPAGTTSVAPPTANPGNTNAPARTKATATRATSTKAPARTATKAAATKTTATKAPATKAPTTKASARIPASKAPATKAPSTKATSTKTPAASTTKTKTTTKTKAPSPTKTTTPAKTP